MKSERDAGVRWFSAEQALGWALQAYYAACREVAGTDAGGGDFVHAFHSAFTLRVSLAAFAHGGVVPCGSATEVLGWPDNADSVGKVAFFRSLRLAGLPLPENACDNAAAGESA